LPASVLPDGILSEQTTALALILILSVVFLFYLDTLWFAFVIDDLYQIVGNTWLRSWKYVPRYFTGDVWAFTGPVFHGVYYRPVFLTWFRLQYFVFGLAPWGWHFCTVLCHLGATLLVYYTAAELLKDRLAALFATLIFGLHPTHAEAVAWVSGVNEPLFAVFLLASFLCYLKARTVAGHARIYQVSSLLLYVVACFTKETAVILPLIIFACEFLGHEQDRPSRLKRSLGALKVIFPYLVCLAGYFAARVISLREYRTPPDQQPFRAMFLTWPSVLWFYIQHMVWPTHLSPTYRGDFYSRVDLHHVILPALLVLAVGAGLWFLAKRSTRAAIAVTWMVAPILPVLYLRAFITGHLVHDRYLYLPSFGFALLIALALRHIRFGSTKVLGQPVVQFALVGVISLAMGLDLIKATSIYANQAALSAYDDANLGPRPRSAQDKARDLWVRGRHDEALALYQKEWLTHPNDWLVNFTLGRAYYIAGKFSDADRYLSRAVQIDASRPESFFYLGLTKWRQGDLNAAAARVRQAISLWPDAYEYHRALGEILEAQGDLPGALAAFRQEVDLNPDDSQARQEADLVEHSLAAKNKRPSPGSSSTPPGNSAVR
jgi:hypothetical protein